MRLKVSRSAIELAAPAIRRTPSPFGYRPAVARVSIELTTSPLWAERSGRLSYLAMVGHRGIEPRDTCVSGRPLRPAGSWPADAAGVEPARPRLARVQAGFRHQIGLRTHERRGRESNSQGRSSTAFGADPVANRVASPWRRTEYSKPTRKEPRAFQAVTAPWRLHPPWTVRATRWGSGPFTARTAESGELESHGVTRALVSSEARYPDRFTLRTLPGIRTRTSSF